MVWIEFPRRLKHSDLDVLDGQPVDRFHSEIWVIAFAIRLNVEFAGG